MDKVRLQFWNALRHFCILFLAFFAILTLLEYAGKLPNLLKSHLVPVSSLEYVRFLPPDLARAWIPLAVLSFSFAVLGYVAIRQQYLWHPSGFKTLPAPNGGYLRKANAAHLRKELAKKPWKTKREVKKHFKKAEKHFDKNQYRSAAAEYQKSAAKFATMSAHLNEGIALCYTSLFRKAADAFDRGYTKALGRKDDAFASAFHSNISVQYRELGSMEEAHARFKEAYGICMRAGDSLGRLCAVGNSATLLLARKEADDAVQTWRDALEGLTEIRCQAALAVAFDGVGRALTAKKDAPEALDHHRKALKIFRTHRCLPGITGALANIGQANARVGRLWRSRRISRKALKLAVWYGSLLDQATIHANIGLADAKRDRPEDAVKSAEKALKLYEQIENPLKAARQLADIAVIRASQGNTKEALKKLAEARRGFQKAEANVAEYRSLEKRIRLALRKNPDDGSGNKSAEAQVEPMVLAEQA